MNIFANVNNKKIDRKTISLKKERIKVAMSEFLPNKKTAIKIKLLDHF